VGQLKKMSKDLTNDAKDVQINNQLKLMLEEQARIENFILKQEDKFSLFGWLVRII